MAVGWRGRGERGRARGERGQGSAQLGGGADGGDRRRGADGGRTICRGGWSACGIEEAARGYKIFKEQQNDVTKVVLHPGMTQVH